MAQVTLTAIGSAVAGPIGAVVGATAGAMIDRAAIDALKPPREVGPRLTGLHVSSAAEGAPMPAVFGRARIAGQVIWAARFRERRITRRTGGGKGDPRFAGRRCDKRFATCGAVFENAANFQGFPDLPGDDFLTLYPGEGERHDGGSRR